MSETNKASKTSEKTSGTNEQVFDTVTRDDVGNDDTPTYDEVDVRSFEREKPEQKDAPDGSKYLQSRYMNGKRVGIVFVSPVMNLVEMVGYYKGDRTRTPSLKAVFMDKWTYEDAEGKKITVDQIEANAKTLMILQWSEIDMVVYKLQKPELWGITGKDDLDACWDKLVEMYLEALKTQGLPDWDDKADHDAPLKWRPELNEKVVAVLYKRIKRNKELTHNLVYIKEDKERGVYRSSYMKLDDFTEVDEQGNETSNKTQFILGRMAKKDGQVILEDDGSPRMIYDILPWESLEDKRAQGRVVIQIHNHFVGPSVKNRIRAKNVMLVSEPSSGQKHRAGMGRLMQLGSVTGAQTSKASSALSASLMSNSDMKPVAAPPTKTDPITADDQTADEEPPIRRRQGRRTGGLRAALNEGVSEAI